MSERTLGRLFALLLVALLMLVGVVWVLRLIGETKLLQARQRFEAETGSLSLADYALPHLEDEANAAVWLRAGAERLAGTDQAGDLLTRVLTTEMASWSRVTREELASLIADNREAIGLLERSVGSEGSSFEFDYEEGFSAVTPPMLDLYRAGRLMAADLRLALVEGDAQRAARDLEILDQLSRALARESFLLSSLMHLGVERLFLGAIRDVIESDIGDPDLLDRLRRKLAQRNSADVLRRGIGGEAAAVVSAAGLRGTASDSSDRAARVQSWLFEPYQLAALLDEYAQLVVALGAPWNETLEGKRSMESGVGWASHEFLLTNLRDAVDKLKAIELTQALAARSLDLAREALERGELPRDLPGEISDPYASGPVVYQLAADGGATLTAPKAIDLWVVEHAAAEARQRPAFRWIIPAP